MAGLLQWRYARLLFLKEEQHTVLTYSKERWVNPQGMKNTSNKTR